jgi:DNA-binding transcriptional LysR family regulator
VRLLQRSTRRIALTDPGRQFHGRCVLLLADLEDAESEARNAQTNVRGQIRLVAPQTFGETFLMPVLGEFLTKESEITLDLMLTDRFVDLVEERFDLAVRIADLPDSSLVARRLGDMQLVLCAAPAYLAAHGVPNGSRLLVRLLHVDAAASAAKLKQLKAQVSEAISVTGRERQAPRRRRRLVAHTEARRCDLRSRRAQGRASSRTGSWYATRH